MQLEETTQKEFITIDETVTLTGYSKQALANFRMQKIKYPFYKDGRQIKYEKLEIIAIINKGRVSVSEDTEA